LRDEFRPRQSASTRETPQFVWRGLSDPRSRARADRPSRGQSLPRVTLRESRRSRRECRRHSSYPRTSARPYSSLPSIGIGEWSRPHSPPSRPGEFRPEPLTEPDVNLSIHPARATPERLPPCGKTCRLQGRAVGQAPGPMGTADGLCREGMSDVPPAEPIIPHLTVLPLLPDHGSQPASDPFIQLSQHRGCLAETEVALPATQVAGELLRHLFQTHAPRPSRQFPNSLLTPEQSLGRDAPFSVLSCR
jgi:hypothetical protein